MTIFNYNCSECDKPFRSEYAIGPPAFCRGCQPNQPKWIILPGCYSTEKITIDGTEYEMCWVYNCNRCLKHYYAIKDAMEECTTTLEVDNENSRSLLYDLQQHIYHDHENYTTYVVKCSDCHWKVCVNEIEEADTIAIQHNAEKGHDVDKGAVAESNIPVSIYNNNQAVELFEMVIKYGNNIIFEKNEFDKKPKKSVIWNHIKRLAAYTNNDGYKNTGNYIVIINGKTEYLVEVFDDTMVFGRIEYMDTKRWWEW